MKHFLLSFILIAFAVAPAAARSKQPVYSKINNIPTDSLTDFIPYEQQAESLSNSAMFLYKATPEQLSSIVLPELKTLIENSQYSPEVIYYTEIAEEQYQALRLERRSWLDYFRLTGQYQYGTGLYYQNSVDNNLSGLVYQTSEKAQHSGSAGMMISFPISEFFNRGVNKKMYSAKINQAQMQGEKVHQEIVVRIIESYTSAQRLIEMVKSTLTALNYATAQYDVAEQEFLDGRKTPAELSYQKSVQTDAQEKYELAKAELGKAILTIERLSLTKIIKYDKAK